MKETEDGEKSWEPIKICDDSSLHSINAVKWLCQQKKIDIQPLTKISIPITVFRECDSDQWFDISDFYFALEMKNNGVNRLAELGAPEVIMDMETMELWKRVEMLETGMINRDGRKWSHGRIIRGLNDIGFSLIDGWDEGMNDYFEKYFDEPDEDRLERWQKMSAASCKMHVNRLTAIGISKEDANKYAVKRVFGNPTQRLSSVEGMGIWLPLTLPPRIFADFLGNHRLSFIKSDFEQSLYDRIISGEDANYIFSGSDYELDGSEYACDHWGVAVANIMRRETGLSFDVCVADPDDKFSNRSCILFPERNPWLYNEKEKRLSRNMLYQILDRYALELRLQAAKNCYYVFNWDDD